MTINETALFVLHRRYLEPGSTMSRTEFDRLKANLTRSAQH